MSARLGTNTQGVLCPNLRKGHKIGISLTPADTQATQATLSSQSWDDEQVECPGDKMAMPDPRPGFSDVPRPSGKAKASDILSPKTEPKARKVQEEPSAPPQKCTAVQDSSIDRNVATRDKDQVDTIKEKYSLISDNGGSPRVSKESDSKPVINLGEPPGSDRISGDNTLPPSTESRETNMVLTGCENTNTPKESVDSSDKAWREPSQRGRDSNVDSTQSSEGSSEDSCQLPVLNPENGGPGGSGPGPPLVDARPLMDSPRPDTPNCALGYGNDPPGLNHEGALDQDLPPSSDDALCLETQSEFGAKPATQMLGDQEVWSGSQKKSTARESSQNDSKPDINRGEPPGQPQGLETEKPEKDRHGAACDDEETAAEDDQSGEDLPTGSSNLLYENREIYETQPPDGGNSFQTGCEQSASCLAEINHVPGHSLPPQADRGPPNHVCSNDLNGVARGINPPRQGLQNQGMSGSGKGPPDRVVEIKAEKYIQPARNSGSIQENQPENENSPSRLNSKSTEILETQSHIGPQTISPTKSIASSRDLPSSAAKSRDKNNKKPVQKVCPKTTLLPAVTNDVPRHSQPPEANPGQKNSPRRGLQKTGTPGSGKGPPDQVVEINSEEDSSESIQENPPETESRPSSLKSKRSEFYKTQKSAASRNQNRKVVFKKRPENSVQKGCKKPTRCLDGENDPRRLSLTGGSDFSLDSTQSSKGLWPGRSQLSLALSMEEKPIQVLQGVPEFQPFVSDPNLSMEENRVQKYEWVYQNLRVRTCGMMMGLLFHLDRNMSKLPVTKYLDGLIQEKRLPFWFTRTEMLETHIGQVDCEVEKTQCKEFRENEMVNTRKAFVGQMTRDPLRGFQYNNEYAELDNKIIGARELYYLMVDYAKRGNVQGHHKQSNTNKVEGGPASEYMLNCNCKNIVSKAESAMEFFQIPRGESGMIAKGNRGMRGKYDLIKKKSVEELPEIQRDAEGFDILSTTWVSKLDYIDIHHKKIIIVEKHCLLKFFKEYAHSRDYFLINGKGYPDFATLNFLTIVQKTLRQNNSECTMQYFGDLDIYGIHIYLEYEKFLNIGWAGLRRDKLEAFKDLMKPLPIERRVEHKRLVDKIDKSHPNLKNRRANDATELILQYGEVGFDNVIKSIGDESGYRFVDELLADEEVYEKKLEIRYMSHLKD